MKSQSIYIKNLSTVVPDADLAKAVPAFQRQMTGDFAPLYGLDAEIFLIGKNDTPPAHAWMLFVLDDADQAGALGYHDLASDGAPIGKVFAGTTINSGGLWTVTFSHELLEMRADPFIRTVIFDDRHHRLYAYEVADAVEADDLAYSIDGVKVSDFVLPSWFQPDHAVMGGRFAFRSNVLRPFGLMPGGYIGIYDIRFGGGWQELTARRDDLHHAKHSRHERRQRPAELWVRSRAA